MTVLSLMDAPKLNNNENNDIFSILLDTGWIKILSESAIKILIYFSYQLKKGQSLVASYDDITNNTDLSRSSIRSGLSELEAFGFIVHIKTMSNKKKIYDLCFNVIKLNENWTKFFKDKLFKEVTINFLLGNENTEVKLKKIRDMLQTNEDSFNQSALRKLIFLSTKSNFTIKELLLEEKIKMEDDCLFTAEELGLVDKDYDWQDILSNEEKNNKFLMDILEHYVLHVNFPTRKDIDLIKKAYEICYPYQIKNAITSIKNHPKFGAKFTNFNYIYQQLINGRFQTRTKNNLKKDFKTEAQNNKKPNNQTDIGFKTSSQSREDIIKAMEEASERGEEFNFSSLNY